MSTTPPSKHHPGYASADRQLVRPTAHIPWSVDVVAAVPKKIFLNRKQQNSQQQQILDRDQIAAGATCPNWSCLAMRDGYVCVWPYQPIALSEKMESPKHCLKLFFTELICGPAGTDEANPLLALSSGEGEQKSIHLYAYKKPYLIMKKISQKDVLTANAMMTPGGTHHSMMMPRGHTAKLRVDLGDDDDNDDNNEDAVVSLTVHESNGMVVLGTAKGRLLWITYTAVPVGLHLQTIEPATGWLDRINPFASSSSVTSPKNSLQHVLPTSPTQFLALCSQAGSIVKWDVTLTIASGHHASFEATPLGTLMMEADLGDDREILKAVLSPDKQSIYAIVRGTSPQQRETRLYWIHMALDGSLKASHWLSRFPLPDQVEVLGLSASENGNVYAAFSTSDVVVAMVLLGTGEDAGGSNNSIIQEVDVPPTHVPSLLPNLFAKDVVTHGCRMMASSGIGIRVRYLPRDDDGPSSKRARMASSSNPATLHTLAQHLRSYFWQSYQDVDVHRPMPPSLKQASASDLEEAIQSLASQLQHMGDTSSAQNPMEWHKAFCKLLQRGGLYRSISQRGRWKLVAIGQELAAFGVLTHMMANHEWQQTLKPYDISDWLLNIQTRQMDMGWPQQHDKRTWNALLSNSLNAATEYREVNAAAFYDVVSDVPSETLWLSHKSLQMVLRRQLDDWRQQTTQDVEPAQLEAVVRATLCSFSEAHESKEEYANMKALAIALLRSTNNDELAFELSIQYLYFKGLCQISVDHEKRRDAGMYSLDPLFTTIEGKDLLSGYSFAQFVLQWHTDKGLFGHAINYGRHSPADLTLIMSQDERLRRYRWIPALRQGYFENATTSCLDICKENKQLGANHWALSMAKLSSKLVATQNRPREMEIEKSLELVDAQKTLMEGDENSKSAPLQPADALVRLALKRLRDAPSMEDRVVFAATGLAVCTSMGNNADATEQASKVWAECLRLDTLQFTRWLQQENDLTSGILKETVLKDTVFGWLLEECRKDDALSSVTYGMHIEKAVMDRIGGKAELTRLLRSVTAPTDSIQGQSLVVASF